MSNCSCNSQITSKTVNSLTTLDSLQEALSGDKSAELVFRYDSEEILSGYHVTEVKAVSIASLDCGAHGEDRRETVIQLWNVAEEGKQHMAAGKFLSIIDRVAARAPLAEDAPLIFEISRPGEAMRLYSGGTLARNGNKLVMELTPYSASCKPADKAMAMLSAIAPQLAASCC